jgi:hypothetical protein
MPIEEEKKINTGSPIKLGMTVGVLSEMTVGVLSGKTEVMSFPRKRESMIKRAWIPNQVGDDSGGGFRV